MNWLCVRVFYFYIKKNISFSLRIPAVGLREQEPDSDVPAEFYLDEAQPDVRFDVAEAPVVVTVNR